MKGKLFVISGPSGSGKTTLSSHALKVFKNLRFSVSYTTREKRQNEVDGVDYHFISRSKFESMLENNSFAEWALVHGNNYGTPIKDINKSIEEGTDVLLDIDVQGAEQLKRKFDQGVFIFVAPPSIEMLEERLKKRNLDKKEVISLRLNKVRQEIERSKHYDYIIINEDIDVSKKAIESIIIVERNESKDDEDVIRKSSEITADIKSDKIYNEEIVNRFELN